MAADLLELGLVMIFYLLRVLLLESVDKRHLLLLLLDIVVLEFKHVVSAVEVIVNHLIVWFAIVNFRLSIKVLCVCWLLVFPDADLAIRAAGRKEYTELFINLTDCIDASSAVCCQGSLPSI